MVKTKIFKALCVFFIYTIIQSCTESVNKHSDLMIENAVSNAYNYVYTDLDSAEICLKEANSFIETATEKGEYKYLLAKYHIFNNRWGKIEFNDSMQSLVTYLEKDGNDNEKMRIYYIIGSQYERAGENMKALEWLRKGWEIAKKEKKADFDYSISSYIGFKIGWILMNEGSSLLAKDYIMKSSQHIGMRKDSVIGLSVVSMAYYFIEEYDSARIYADRVFDIIKANGNNKYYTDRIIPQIEMYVYLNEWDKVEERMPYVLERLKNYRDDLELTFLAEWYIHLGLFHEADSVLRKVNPNSNVRTTYYTYKSYSHLFSKQHINDSALHYALLCIQYEDSILKKNDYSQAHVIDQLYNLEMAHEKENTAIKAKYRILWMCVIVSILLIVSLVISYRIHQYYKEKNQHLNRLYETALKKVDVFKHNYEVLHRIINNSTKEPNLINASEINTFIEELKKKSEVGKNITTEEQERIVDICTYLYPNLDEKLNEIYSKFSAKHKLICMLTLLNFKPSMIKNILNISSQSITYANKFVSYKITGKAIGSSSMLRAVLSDFINKVE